MARLLLLLLLVTALGLIAALWLDRRTRRSERLFQLRASFLHGKTFADGARAGDHKRVLIAGGALELRLPVRWAERTGSGDALSLQLGSGGLLTVGLDTLTLDAAEAASPEGWLQALGRWRPERERSLERLANGNALTKALDSIRERGEERMVYTWRLARPLRPDLARTAVFTVSVPMLQAGDVLTQSDLATLDHAVREAELSAQDEAS